MLNFNKFEFHTCHGRFKLILNASFCDSTWGSYTSCSPAVTAPLKQYNVKISSKGYAVK
ncbi:hypothetical protein M413DRAFT_154969 [Hebeloma cylindrosporum]|uniref:Uncharacterized protein n=1 Tax=Hebeloma cylindrosporum TaxID=76867 RepID=A0A0C3CB79_HEBCY|nr:hypothetical protein M413DRAFT_154969 [Hebeloma cylindrosporum h7]